MVIRYNSAESAARIVAIDDGVETARYEGVLLRCFFIADDGEMYSSVEWGVKDIVSDKWVATYPLSGYLRKRACDLKCDFVLSPSEKPFPISLLHIPKDHPCFENPSLELLPVDEDTVFGVFSDKMAVTMVN